MKSEGPVSSPALARLRQMGGKWGDKDQAERKLEPVQRDPLTTKQVLIKERHSMKNSKLVGGLLALSLYLPFAVATGQAQKGVPSAKVTAETSAAVLIPATTGTGDWVTVLSSQIKTANKKELFIWVAMETGLFTRTEAPPDATAGASVQGRVLVDGQEVEPGPVVYGRRIQSLEADEEVELSLDTLDAASFTFVELDVPVGVHSIEVQARVVTGGSGDFSAMGAVGKGTMVAESERMAN
jgi:hypothetical protein